MKRLMSNTLQFISKLQNKQANRQRIGAHLLFLFLEQQQEFGLLLKLSYFIIVVAG